MLNRIGMVVMLLAVVFAGLPGALEAATGKNKVGKVEGTLTAASATGVVIRKQGGTTVSLAINSATKIEKNGVRVAITALVIGNPVQALFDPATNVATKVEQK